jgi:hypothetical protein
LPFNVVAAFSYSGANRLQWPHQGALKLQYIKSVLEVWIKLEKRTEKM